MKRARDRPAKVSSPDGPTPNSCRRDSVETATSPVAPNARPGCRRGPPIGAQVVQVYASSRKKRLEGSPVSGSSMKDVIVRFELSVTTSVRPATRAPSEQQAVGS